MVAVDGIFVAQQACRLDSRGHAQPVERGIDFRFPESHSLADLDVGNQPLDAPGVPLAGSDPQVVAHLRFDEETVLRLCCCKLQVHTPVTVSTCTASQAAWPAPLISSFLVRRFQRILSVSNCPGRGTMENQFSAAPSVVSSR